MANNPFFSDEATKAAVDAVAALCNSGTLKIYSGSQPTDANTAIGAQVLLATLTLGSTAFAASSASGSAGSKVVTATANTITGDTSADATGTAAWFRVLKSNGTSIVMDGSVGVSGCDLNVATTAFVTGADIEVTSFAITQLE
jgi:uncharacterized glyoxalase superfamily protein PhnB